MKWQGTIFKRFSSGGMPQLWWHVMTSGGMSWLLVACRNLQCQCLCVQLIEQSFLFLWDLCWGWFHMLFFRFGFSWCLWSLPPWLYLRYQWSLWSADGSTGGRWMENPNCLLDLKKVLDQTAMASLFQQASVWFFSGFFLHLSAFDRCQVLWSPPVLRAWHLKTCCSGRVIDLAEPIKKNKASVVQAEAHHVFQVQLLWWGHARIY